jgi:hypothetical protein
MAPDSSGAKPNRSNREYLLVLASMFVSVPFVVLSSDGARNRIRSGAWGKRHAGIESRLNPNTVACRHIDYEHRFTEHEHRCAEHETLTD